MSNGACVLQLYPEHDILRVGRSFDTFHQFFFCIDRKIEMRADEMI